ncbi:hypothetical protein AWENTII_007602 [Aspergillus wentii]|nr:ATPase synthesis protein 25 mitochondrial [Aspergillus wentii]
MHRALMKGPWCHSCRHDVIRSFSTISGAPVLPRYSLPSRPIWNANNRSFSVSRLRSENPSVNSSGSQTESVEEKDGKDGKDGPASSKHVPWYLQDETSVTEPVLSRDQIPALPEDPPAILPVLLDYTFKDLGLDELKLFDLRGLETPPALGANVIMIIGTARSVKHLNVSADRLCRWLRSNYKLTPYADGLLGRNELKIKLRRKARRARIASQAGAMFDEKDDGITTGWICVNAGVVEESPIEEQVEDRGFEGFGRAAAGTRVVVQMFTEEKRADVNLDGLWEATLKRAEREKQKYSEVTSDAPPKEVRFPATVNSSSSDRDIRQIPRSSVSIPLEQRRGLHSTRRTQNVNSVKAADVNLRSPESIHDTTQHSLGSGISMDSLFQYISGLSDEKALSELGSGPADRESTLFLRLFYDRPPEFSAEEEAEAQIRLMCLAISRQHQAYSKENLWKTFMDYHCSSYHFSDEMGFEVVSAMLAERPINLEGETPSNCLPDEDIELALRVLEHLSMRGTDVLNMKVFNLLYDVAGRMKGLALRRVSQVIEALNVPFDPEQARILMVSLFRNKDYDGFWKLWRKLPLSGSPRTAADYEQLFQLHADLGHEQRARDCILTWVPMMSREEPPIPLQGLLVQHIMYCLLLADPEIQQRAAKGNMNNLTRLWDQCRSNLT